MDRRAYPAQIDPAVAVSGLLTRLSLFLLVVLAPFIAMFSRRAVAILVPVATALLILAAALDGKLCRAPRAARPIPPVAPGARSSSPDRLGRRDVAVDAATGAGRVGASSSSC